MMAPIKVSATRLYPPLIKMWRQLFNSKRLWIALAQKVQMPARKPAVAPQLTSVILAQLPVHSAGVSARNMARFTAINREKIAVKPNIFPLLLDVVSKFNKASLAPVLIPFPSRSVDLANKIQKG